MDWSRDLPTWPLAELSKQIRLAPHVWHVQEAGSGPTVLLLHGAGASTHSWRDILPKLAEDYHVVALDLPSQGFTRAGTTTRCGLDAMTNDIAALLRTQGWAPDMIIGHSAGSAIALNLSKSLDPVPKIVGINAALDRFEGMASWLFPILAKLLALNPLTSLLFSLGRNPKARAARLITSTGSHLSDEGIGFYARLIADRSHVDGTLKMMAQWNIDELAKGFSNLVAPTLFLVGENDGAVAPRVSRRAAAEMPNATVVTLRNLGHLAHEEAPDLVIDHIRTWARSIA